MNAFVDLPADYELVERVVVDSVLDEARRLAVAGADEGTLVWAQEQSGAVGRDGQLLHCPPGNLYACLILHPDCQAEVAVQLNYVAVVSLGAAIAELVPPLTALRYRWPNLLLLNGGIAAGVTLESPPAPHGEPDWTLLGLTVNVADHVETCAPGVTSLMAEGIEEVSVATVLEGFGRQFLSWINRWAVDGFAPVRRHWLQRARGFGEVADLDLADAALRGKVMDLDDRGALILECEDSGRPCLRTLDYSAGLAGMSRPVRGTAPGI